MMDSCRKGRPTRVATKTEPAIRSTEKTENDSTVTYSETDSVCPAGVFYRQCDESRTTTTTTTWWWRTNNNNEEQQHGFTPRWRTHHSHFDILSNETNHTAIIPSLHSHVQPLLILDLNGGILCHRIRHDHNKKSPPKHHYRPCTAHIAKIPTLFLELTVCGLSRILYLFGFQLLFGRVCVVDVGQTQKTAKQLVSLLLFPPGAHVRQNSDFFIYVGPKASVLQYQRRTRTQ